MLNRENLLNNINGGEHLELVQSMLPVVAYLEQDDFMSRLLGRLAWSYIRLGEERIATQLLEYSEKYDLWPAAANYFWASEYSRRQVDVANYAERCLTAFRETVGKIPSFSAVVLPKDDLQLAVIFYEKLIEHERESPVFSADSAKSDVARFYELQARLDQDAAGYEIAEEFYKNAGLNPYAACCRVFRLMYEANKQSEISKKRENLVHATRTLKKLIYLQTNLLKRYYSNF